MSLVCDSAISDPTAAKPLRLVGVCRETLYRDSAGSAWLVELPDGELTIGLAPSVGDYPLFWQTDRTVGETIPSVVYHPLLPKQERDRLEAKLSELV